MDSTNNKYHISFFKPTTTQAKANRNMVVWFISIWAVAIFGFQIALRVLEKPTPEPSYTMYTNVWENVKTGNATEQEYQDFGFASLSVLGKIFIKADEKSALNNALTFVTLQLADSAQKAELLSAISELQKISAEVSSITDANYQAAKLAVMQKAAPLLGLEKTDVRTKLLPLELLSTEVNALSDGDIATIEACMPIYLIHNQSVLTDTKFLGFPFHYFYSAVFLLILFVGLCWLYCVRIDKLNAQLNIAD